MTPVAGVTLTGVNKCLPNPLLSSSIIGEGGDFHIIIIFVF